MNKINTGNNPCKAICDVLASQKNLTHYTIHGLRACLSCEKAFSPIYNRCPCCKRLLRHRSRWHKERNKPSMKNRYRRNDN